jgi:hypothetical protein
VFSGPTLCGRSKLHHLRITKKTNSEPTSIGLLSFQSCLLVICSLLPGRLRALTPCPEDCPISPASSLPQSGLQLLGSESAETSRQSVTLECSPPVKIPVLWLCHLMHSGDPLGLMIAAPGCPEWETSRERGSLPSTGCQVHWGNQQCLPICNEGKLLKWMNLWSRQQTLTCQPSAWAYSTMLMLAKTQYLTPPDRLQYFSAWKEVSLIFCHIFKTFILFLFSVHF